MIRIIHPAPNPCPETCGRDANRSQQHRPEWPGEWEIPATRERKPLLRRHLLQAKKTRFGVTDLVKGDAHRDRGNKGPTRTGVSPTLWLIRTCRLKSYPPQSRVWKRREPVWAMLLSIRRSLPCAHS